MNTTIATVEQNTVNRNEAIESVADIVRQRLPSFGLRSAIRYDDGDTYRSLNYQDYVGNIARALRAFDSDRQKQQVSSARKTTYTKEKPTPRQHAPARLS